MKLKSTALRVAAVTVVGGLVLGAAGTAFAAAPVTGTGGFEPDTANQLGQIVFYDNNGNLQTSGDPTVNGWFGYAVATTDDPVATNTGATLFGYAANSATNIGAWSGKQTSTATQFPVTGTGTPANIAATRVHQPVVSGAQSVVSIASLAGSYPNSTDAKYPNIYQFRIKTPSNTQWWAADIQYTPAAGTTPAKWTQLYPDITATTTSISASPASPSVAGTNVTLTATVTNSAPGTVTFTDTSVTPARTVGTAQTLPGSATNNSVSVVDTAPATGNHSYVATYTQAVGTPYANSASQPLAYSVIPPADSTSTTNAASPTPQYTGTTFTLSSTVTDTQATPNASPANPAGTVTWTDTFTPSGATAANAPTTIGTATLAPTTGSATASNASYTVTGGLSGVGSHSIVASFTPNPSTKWNSSSSAPVTFALAAQPCPPNTCDQQAFQVTVDPGTLTISTPYTTAAPFNLGHMQLDPKGTILRASAPFGAGTDGKGVTITDTRAGQLGWTASVTTTDFTGSKSTNVINGQNLSFTGVGPQYVTGNALQAGSVTPTDVTTAADSSTNPGGYGPTATGSDGLKGGPHQFAKAAAGNSVGTVYVTGTMKIVAPTSTNADTYNGTVTFTIA